MEFVSRALLLFVSLLETSEPFFGVSKIELAREKLEAEIRAVQSNGHTTSKLEGFMGVTTVQATEKGVLNSEAAIALSKHIRESRLETARDQ